MITPDLPADKPAEPTSCWIVIGDLHGTPGRFVDIPELREAAGILVTGDITLRGGIAQAREVLDALRDCHPVVYAQIGNMDHSEITDWLEAQGWNIHKALRCLAPDVALFGVGGSTPTPFATPSEFPEQQYAQ